MSNFCEIKTKHTSEHNLIGLLITNHPYRIFIVGDFGLGKANDLLN